MQHDSRELAAAIEDGLRHRPEQAFGAYFEGRTRSCALGAAYEGMYRIPDDISGSRMLHLERLFDCLDTLKSCPAGCKKTVNLASMIVHLNDDHLWTRERIVSWLAE
jgi:hypothetical protein